MNEIQIRNTAAAMAEAYKTADAEIAEAYRLLDRARGRLGAAFANQSGDPATFYTIPDSNTHQHAPSNARDLPRDIWEGEGVRLANKATAWRIIARRLEIRNTMSTKRAAEFDASLQNPQTLPDVTAENVLATAISLINSIPTYISEVVKEVFDYLRPDPRWGKAYKTNEKWKIGERVILHICFAYKWDQNLRAYERSSELRNLESVFRLLDGKGPVEGTGELYTAIDNTNFGDTAETEYFRIKPCKNGNVHIQFKRLDLVDDLNSRAGGNALSA